MKTQVTTLLTLFFVYFFILTIATDQINYQRKKEKHQGRKTFTYSTVLIQQCQKEKENTPETIKSPGALNSNYYTEYYPQGHINKLLLPNKRNQFPGYIRDVQIIPQREITDCFRPTGN